MFLHAGASLHGHEYSTARSSPQMAPRRLPFLRSALRQTPEPDSRPSTATQPPTKPIMTSTDSPPPSSRPTSFHEHVTPAPRTSRPRPNSDYIPKRELSVRFREPETDDDLPPPSTANEYPPSEDDGSFACSDLSDLSDSSNTVKKRRKRKRAPRKSTQFILAHPAPRLRTKQRRLVQIRPRLMLQLQELSDKRPIPAFDVVPSSLVAGSIILPRLAMRCPRLFRVKPELGPNDLLVVRSEDYDSPASPSSPDVADSLDQRDLLAVISPLPHQGDHAVEIVMEDGSTWESSVMPNGSYEFIGVDERGGIRTARWIKKLVPTPRPAPQSLETPPSSPVPPEFKWTFSMINPDTRRHPIMGSLASNTLDVFDTYNTMSTSSGRYPPTRPANIDPNGLVDWVSSNPYFKEGRLTMTVPQDLKLLMVATAAWLNLRQEGWPANANPKYSQSLALTPKRAPSISMQARAQTFPIRPTPTVLQKLPPKCPTTTTTPVPSFPEYQTQEAPGRRRSMSTSGGLRNKFIPRASMDTGRPALADLYLNEVERLEKLEKPPPSRRLSVRQLTNKLFRRRANSQVQQDSSFVY